MQEESWTESWNRKRTLGGHWWHEKGRQFSSQYCNDVNLIAVLWLRKLLTCKLGEGYMWIAIYLSVSAKLFQNKQFKKGFYTLTSHSTPHPNRISTTRPVTRARPFLYKPLLESYSSGVWRFRYFTRVNMGQTCTVLVDRGWGQEMIYSLSPSKSLPQAEDLLVTGLTGSGLHTFRSITKCQKVTHLLKALFSPHLLLWDPEGNRAQPSLTPTCTPKCACLACACQACTSLDTAAGQGYTKKMTFSHQTIKIDFGFKTINWSTHSPSPFQILLKWPKK